MLISSEALTPQPETVTEIDEVFTQGSPEYEAIPCFSCEDGTMNYSQDPLSSKRFGTGLKVSKIWAYRCDSCDFVAVLPEVRNELRMRIEGTESEI